MSFVAKPAARTRPDPLAARKAVAEAAEQVPAPPPDDERDNTRGHGDKAHEKRQYDQGRSAATKKAKADKAAADAQALNTDLDLSGFLLCDAHTCHPHPRPLA